MRTKKQTSPRHVTASVVAVAAPLTVLCALASSELLATGLLPGATGALAGTVAVYLLTLRRERRRTVAALLIFSWFIVLAGSTFLPAPAGTHPVFDLREPEGCLAYGFALGFGVAAVGRWVNAGSATGRPGSKRAGPRSRCRRVAAKPGAAGRPSRCSPVERVEGSEGAP